MISSFVIPFDTASGGASLDLSSIKLPISVGESSPIKAAKETGFEEADNTVFILAFGAHKIRNEEERLRALAEYRILGTEPE